MKKNTTSATVNKAQAQASAKVKANAKATTEKATVNKYADLLAKSNACDIPFKDVYKADGKTLADDVRKVVATYKTSAWEFAKLCYFANKVKGIKVETLATLFDVSYQNISKHANNVEYLLTAFGKGYDAYADQYSVSKVDLIRKAKDKGCYKKVAFEDVIQKKRSDIERAIAKGTDAPETKADTVLISMSDGNGNECQRAIPKSTWEQWLKESKAE